MNNVVLNHLELKAVRNITHALESLGLLLV